GHVFDADSRLVAAHLDDAVHHEKRVAVRQRLEDLGDINRLDGQDLIIHAAGSCSSSPSSDARRFWAKCSSTFTSRNHCFTGLAGVPPQRAPGGTSPPTMLIAAICAPSPIVALLLTPTRAPNT